MNVKSAVRIASRSSSNGDLPPSAFACGVASLPDLRMPSFGPQLETATMREMREIRKTRVATPLLLLSSFPFLVLIFGIIDIHIRVLSVVTFLFVEYLFLFRRFVRLVLS